ncbi:MAG: dihydroorotase family protein, partial [Melioribacteraceae bacterium]|nr:dihydroorotase family protein [Melioribacteraceae bacterium]
NNAEIRNYLKTAPPVKHSEDLTCLWNGLKNGSISFVTTDHAGCDPQKEKVSDNFWEVYGGIPGVEHRVPYLFSEGFLKQKLSLSKTIELLSTNVAECFNLTSKGRIEENYDADFALIDLWTEDSIEAERMHSKGKYTPFEGLRVNAVVDKTFLRGNMVMNKEGETEKGIGYGNYINVKKP